MISAMQFLLLRPLEDAINERYDIMHDYVSSGIDIETTRRFVYIHRHLIIP